MLPNELKAEHFAGYPPEARKLVLNYLETIEQLPVSFVPGLLRELIDYDFKFPAERSAREKELATLQSLSSQQRSEWFQGFAGIHLSREVEDFDWVHSPAQFVERLSADLWRTHQLDAFRTASNHYAERLRAATPPAALPIPRLGITVIGQGVSTYDNPLFRKLRPHGGYFAHVNRENGLQQLLDAVAARAKSHFTPYGHWYIDGGEAADHAPELTCVSYKGLEPARAALLRRMQTAVSRPGMGPEALRTIMAQLRPADLGMEKTGATKQEQVMDRFQISLLTEGSGTQIFSTSFTQWAAREALRRAQPLTLLVRFAQRQRQKPMSELLAAVPDRPEFDPVGSLIDADFGAYYNWINQQRLPGAEQSSFIVWFEGHSQAVAIGPGMPRGTESASSVDLRQLLAWAV